MELSIVCPYRCTFADPRQMEYMYSSVYCIYFPRWNGLDQTSAVLGSTLHQNADLIPGYKPRYRLEVLLFHFHLGQAVRSHCNTSFPQTEVSGTSSVSLWTEEQIAEMWNVNGRAIGYSVREELWFFAVIQAVWARPIKHYFVNDYCSVVLRGVLHEPADLNSEKCPGYTLNVCFHYFINLFKIITCNSEWHLLQIIQRK